MTARDDFNGIVSDWLDDQAGRGAPDYLDQVLARTTRTRQRPAWSSFERWLPVQTTLRYIPVPRVAWVLVILALVAAIGVAALSLGARRPNLPPPFGPARNGAIVFGGTDHDIYQLNSISGATAALVTGSTSDRDPAMSRDGTRFVFLRDTAISDPVLGTVEPMIMVANADGSDIRAVSPALSGFHATTWSSSVQWSNDGSRLAVAHDVGGKPAIELFQVDGSVKPVVVSTGGDASFMSFRPGDRELTFNRSNGDTNGLYAVGADGRGLRTILEPANADYASLSPDGTKLAYAAPGGPLNAYNVIRVVDVDTGLVRMPNFVPPVSGQGQADAQSWWSPDGSMLLFQRYVGGKYRMAVAPETGGPVVEIGPTMLEHGGQRVEAQFSPDGLQVIVHYDDGGATWLLDTSGATKGIQLPDTIAETATWQRLALAP